MGSAGGRARIGATELIGGPTRAEIFAAVLTGGPVSRTGLARRLGLAHSSVTRMLPPLLEGGYLRESESVSLGRGRPQRMLRVNPDKHAVVGVKIGPDRVAGVVTDLAARVLARAEQPLEDCTPGPVLAAAAELTGRLLDAAPSGAADRVLGLGVGVSGHVEPALGTCRYSAMLGWRSVDVAGPLTAATGLPVVVHNDVNTLVVAERWFGQGRDVDDFAVVTVGPGIGCGLLLGGTLYTGSTSMAGELGHVPVDPRGPVCGCGRRGCLEALASDGAVVDRVRAAGPFGCAGIGEAAALARDGSGAAGDAARAAFADAGTALGLGLAGLCNLLALQEIIIAGEGAAAYDLFGPSMTATLEEHAFSDAARDCVVRVHPVDDDMWARGAACLVVREAVRAPIS